MSAGPIPPVGERPKPTTFGQDSDGRWHYRRSLASRLIVLTTLAVALAIALVAIGAYLAVRIQMQASLDQSLQQRAKTASSSLCDGNLKIPPAYYGATNGWILCISSDGVRLSSTIKFGSITLGEAEAQVIGGEAKQSVRTIRADDSSTRWRVLAQHRDGGETMIVAQSLEDQEAVLGKLGLVMSIFGVAGVLGAALAGWAVARNGLRPVRRLTGDVERIARTEDLRPLRIEGDDEIARLAAAFNQMLITVEASRNRQRQLVADAGHELRTPLTALRTNLELLSQMQDADGPQATPEQRAELFGDIRAQIEELTNLIGDLSELARDEPMAPVVELLDLSEVVHQALARVRLRAPGLHYDVLAHHWWMIGDAATLERAITNLLDNAAKWSPPEGRVSVHLVDGVLTVDDEGPGIAEPDRVKVFDRFWRADESRTMPGSGLGLSIVWQVADRHGGSVRAEANPAGGARMVFSVPGSAAPPPPPPATPSPATPSPADQTTRADQTKPDLPHPRGENPDDD